MVLSFVTFDFNGHNPLFSYLVNSEKTILRNLQKPNQRLNGVFKAPVRNGFNVDDIVKCPIIA